MKMDRRLLLMQNIKVRKLLMKKIYDQLLRERKLQMLPEDKDSAVRIITNLTPWVRQLWVIRKLM